MARIVKILNWMALPELVSLSLLCVCIKGRDQRSVSGDRTPGKIQVNKKFSLWPRVAPFGQSALCIRNTDH
jgi:hypothetical protein